jgi:FkbM family methyltransferase
VRRYPIGKFILQVPDDHKIIEIHREAVFYDRAYGMIIEEIARRSPVSVFLDIGGNVGDTAAFFATYAANPIVSVEGSPQFLGYYKSNLRYFGDQVQLIEKFVRTDALRTAGLSYVAEGGTGYLKASNTSTVEESSFISIDELLSRVGSPGLVKSDTDGMDGFIILDMLNKAPESPLFFECDTMLDLVGIANPWREVFDRLGDYAVVIFDNQGLPMLATFENATQLLRDLSGYLHLQRGVQPLRIHYLDIWAFPRSCRKLFDAVVTRLREDMLKPYGF